MTKLRQKWQISHSEIIRALRYSFHCRAQQAIRRAKDFYLENLARVAVEEQNGPGLWEFTVESGSWG